MVKAKRRVNRRHAIYRALQRYGVSLNKLSYEGLVNQITSGRSIFVSKVGDNRTAHAVTFEGELMLAIYDKCRKSIVTFLPKKAWKIVE